MRHTSQRRRGPKGRQGPHRRAEPLDLKVSSLRMLSGQSHGALTRIVICLCAFRLRRVSLYKSQIAICASPIVSVRPIRYFLLRWPNFLRAQTASTDDDAGVDADSDSGASGGDDAAVDFVTIFV
jgi:hypothetical protein